MRQILRLVVSIIIVGCTFSSCKVDNPIYPDNPNFVPYQGSGGVSASANNVNMAYLNGGWELRTTYNELYGPSNALLSSTLSALNAFTVISIDNTAKSFAMQGAATISSGTFTLSVDGSSSYIQLSQDPFIRLSNDKILITNLTATGMTWLVYVDPQAGSSKSAYKVVFTKRL